MASYTIIVEFRIDAQDMPAFLELVTANAATSLRDEPGCARFDVLVPKGETDRVVLYEIYDDAAAFAEHCRSPHFHSFNLAASALVREKRVTEFALMAGPPLAAAKAEQGVRGGSAGGAR